MKCIGRRWRGIATWPVPDATLEHEQEHELEHAQQMKERILEGFGARLAELRQARGLSQDELATLVDVSRRVYYEVQSAQPPGALLVDLARALKVSTDELLGVKPVRETLSPRPRGSSHGSAASKSSRPPTSAPSSSSSMR
jgi:ribosome-binding protein aMBF1 (putative translation factor)